MEHEVRALVVVVGPILVLISFGRYPRQVLQPIFSFLLKRASTYLVVIHFIEVTLMSYETSDEANPKTRVTGDGFEFSISLFEVEFHVSLARIRLQQGAITEG